MNYRTDNVVFVSGVIKLKYILFLDYLLAEDIQTHDPKIKTVIFLETIMYQQSQSPYIKNLFSFNVNCTQKDICREAPSLARAVSNGQVNVVT